MKHKLFVGNLSWKVREHDLRELFEPFGPVEEAVVVLDRFTGRSKGFGFVTFQDEAHADAALAALAGREVDGRPLRVDHATERPRTERLPDRDERR